jgi:hypothetical protein
MGGRGGDALTDIASYKSMGLGSATEKPRIVPRPSFSTRKSGTAETNGKIPYASVLVLNVDEARARQPGELAKKVSTSPYSGKGMTNRSGILTEAEVYVARHAFGPQAYPAHPFMISVPPSVPLSLS